MFLREINNHSITEQTGPVVLEIALSLLKVDFLIESENYLHAVAKNSG